MKAKRSTPRRETPSSRPKEKATPAPKLDPADTPPSCGWLVQDSEPEWFFEREQNDIA